VAPDPLCYTPRLLSRPPQRCRGRRRRRRRRRWWWWWWWRGGIVFHDTREGDAWNRERERQREKDEFPS